MQVASQKMRTNMPWLWKVVTSLLDANPDRRRIRPDFANQEESITDKLSSNQEEDLGEIGGDDMDVDSESDIDMDVDPNPTDEGIEKAKKTKKSRRRASERNAALIVIVRPYQKKKM